MKENKRFRTGMLLPSLDFGGGELTSLYVLMSTNEVVDWSIVVITGEICNEDMLNKFVKYVPVYYDGKLYHSTTSSKCSLEKAIEQLFSCDKIFSWEFDDERFSLLSNYPGKVIHMIFRHAPHLKNYVRKEQILVTCSDDCKKEFGISNLNEITVIPSMTDYNRCFPSVSREEMRSKWNIKNNRIVMGYVGRMDKNKNIPAIARTVRANQGVMEAVCYGWKNRDVASIEKEIYKISPNGIAWYPPIEQVGNIFVGIDVLILPSYSEVFSLTLLEAWFYGIPVVCTCVGETPFLEKKFGKICEYISPDDNGETIGRAVMRAINNKEMVNNARKMVIDNFGYNRIAEMWKEFFLKDV